MQLFLFLSIIILILQLSVCEWRTSGRSPEAIWPDAKKVAFLFFNAPLGRHIYYDDMTQPTDRG